MSFSDLDITIQDMLEDGWKPYEIAEALQIPVDWVYTTMEYVNAA